jgi:hypothetical protein
VWSERMPRASFIDKPKRWRQRAEKTRTLAEQMGDGVSRHMMYHIADDYERLAVRAALRAKWADPILRGPGGHRLAIRVRGGRVGSNTTAEASEPSRPKSGRVRSGRAGGTARAKQLSPAERRAIAMKAAAARWSK